jgi:hypothetical protein
MPENKKNFMKWSESNPFMKFLLENDCRLHANNESKGSMLNIRPLAFFKNTNG